MTLTTVKLISPYLTENNKELIFKETDQKSTREVEKVLAALFPQEEEVLDTIRKLPLEKTAQNLTRSGTSTLSKIRAKGIIKPMTVQRVKIELSASEGLAKKIQRAKELLRHKYPHGKLEDLVREAFELLLEKKDPQRKIQKRQFIKKEISVQNAFFISFAFTGGLSLLFFILPGITSFFADGEYNRIFDQYSKSDGPDMAQKIMDNIEIVRSSLFKLDAIRSFFFITSAAVVVWLFFKSKIRAYKKILKKSFEYD